MPLSKPEDFGTDRSGFRINDFCRHCYIDGAFSDPDITMPQMIDRCVGIMTARAIMPETEARVLLADVMPRLKRWRVTGTKRVL